MRSIETDLNVVNPTSNYRLGDSILFANCAVDELLNNGELFKDTIGYKYAMRCTTKGIFYDWETLRELINEYVEKNNPDLPAENELVIHLRLGDIGAESPVGRLIESEVPTILECIKSAIHETNPEKITVVSALHFQCSEHMTEDIININSSIYNSIMNELDTYNIQITIRSCSIDEDFIYMMSAETLVMSKGGFSTLAGILCNGKLYGPKHPMYMSTYLKHYNKIYIADLPDVFGDLNITNKLIKLVWNIKE